MNDQNNTNNNSFSSLVFGVIVGATLTYLLTNKKGQQIKEHLLKEGKKLLEEVADAASDLEENVTSKLEEGKKEVEEAVSEVPEHIEKLQKKGRRFFFKKTHVNAES